MTKLKRASFRDAIFWIAHNDNAGGGDDREAVEGYISVVLVADLFGTDAKHVAEEVMKLREVKPLNKTTATGERTFRVWCHVCDVEHEIKGHMLSSPLAKRMPDGMQIPVNAHHHHTSEEVMAAYERFTGHPSPARKARSDDGSRRITDVLNRYTARRAVR